MFGWFKHRRRKKGLYPECTWNVGVTSAGIRSTDHRGTIKEVAFDALRSVAIATDDCGPWGADVWWLLYGANGDLDCAFPQGATGEQAALDHLFALPNFDHGEVAKAMGCTAEAVFIVWSREGERA